MRGGGGLDGASAGYSLSRHGDMNVVPETRLQRQTSEELDDGRAA